MKKLILILCFLSVTAHAGWLDNKLTVHNCPTESDAESCSNRCKPSDGLLKFEFITDKPKGNVLQKVFYQNKFATSMILTDCKIFNDKNWDCGWSQYSSVERKLISLEEKMIDGVYILMHKLELKCAK